MGWHWIGNTTEGVKISSESSVALFPSIQFVLRPRNGRLVSGRKGGSVSKDEEETLAFSIPKHVSAGQSLGPCCLK